MILEQTLRPQMKEQLSFKERSIWRGVDMHTSTVKAIGVRHVYALQLKEKIN